MGGNALRNVPTRRYEKDEYELAVKEVSKIITDVLGVNRRFGPIQPVKLKDSFGDMDVLIEKKYESSSFLGDALSFVFEKVNTQLGYGFECVKNSDVYSLNYKDLQVDLIFNDTKSYGYARSYFSFNDQGNLVGRLAHKFGMKHGHRGLVIPVRSGTKELGEIVLTLDYEETLYFLGLNVEQFKAGFDTVEEMFDWVSKSKYFNPSIYLFENVNAVSRIRDKKRATYNKFLEYNKSYTGPVHEGFVSKADAMELVFDHFPMRVEEEFKELVAKAAVLEMGRLKFNGNIVRDLTGYENKELGEFMQYCKSNSKLFSPYMLYVTDQEKINESILRLKERKENELHKGSES